MAEPIIATKQVIEQVFDGAAPRYDREGPSIFRQFGTRLVEWIGITPGARVLDVATGTGAVLIPAAQRVGASGRVVGIDLAGAMLREAGRAAHDAGLSNIKLTKMDAEHLEFPANSFDVVTCAFSLFLFPAMEVALREMRRVLKPGGRVGVTVFGGSPPFDPGWRIFAEQARAYAVAVRTPQRVVYAPAEAQALLAAAGFADIETRVEPNEIVYANEEAWWAFQLTLANRAAILRMSEETRAKFKTEYLAKMRPLFREDGLHLSASVVYALASRQ
jgi:ubiquinone/menaquinone biosynthesis C-methylase UbiE